MTRPDHLEWIADALGVPAPIVASAEHYGDLLSLCVACGVRELRQRGAADAEAGEIDAPWLADLLRAARGMLGDREFTARALSEAGELPYSPPSGRLALVLSTIGSGRCPAPAVLGKALRSVAGIAADGLRLSEVSRRGNVSWYVVEPVGEE